MEKPLLANGVVGHQVWTHIRTDSGPLVFRESFKFLGCHLATQSFSPLQRFSIGLMSGDWEGHSMTLMGFFFSPSFVVLTNCFVSSSCWKTIQKPSSVFWLKEGSYCLRFYTIWTHLLARQCGEVVPKAPMHGLCSLNHTQHVLPSNTPGWVNAKELDVGFIRPHHYLKAFSDH